MTERHGKLTLTAAFYERAESCRTAIAIQDFTNNGQVLGYSELAQRAQAFAKYLAAQGVSAGSSVPLIGKRGVETIVAILGILSCGARYIPLFPKKASASIIFQLHRQFLTKVVVYVSGTTIPSEACLRDIQFVNVRDALLGRQDTEGQKRIDLAPAGGQACCLLEPIHGVGDVGRLRVVSLSHKDLLKASCVAQRHLQIQPDRRVGQVFDVASDLASWPLFACLCHGGTLVIRGQDWHTALAQMEVLICTPAILCNIPSDQFPSIDTIAVAHEIMPRNLTDRWAKQNVRLWLCSLSFASAMLVDMQECTPASTSKRGRLWQKQLLWPGRHRQDNGTEGKLQKFKLVGENTISEKALAFPGVFYAVTIRVDNGFHSFVVHGGVDTRKLRTHLGATESHAPTLVTTHPLSQMPFTADGRPDRVALRRMIETHADVAEDMQPNATVTHSLSQATASSVGQRCGLPRLILSLPALSVIATMVNIALIPVVARTRPEGRLAFGLAASNYAVAMLLHQDVVMNCLVLIVSRLPRKALPLWLRRLAAGIHDPTWFHATVGAWAYLWSLWSAIHITLAKDQDARALLALVTVWVLVVTYSAMIMLAVPMHRRHCATLHSLHLSGGWTLFTLFWVLAFLLPQGAGSHRLFRLEIATSVSVAMLTLPLVCILLSWVTLRRVVATYKPVTDHTMALYISDWVPPPGTWLRVSTSPWASWWCVPATPANQASTMAMGRGCTIVACSSSPWVQPCVGHRPRLVWVRRLPVYDMLQIASLFENILVIATGSGIVPLLSFLRRPVSATRLIWSASAPAEILGQEKLKEVELSAADYVIHDPAGPIMERLGQLVRLVRERAIETPAAEAIFMVGDEPSVQAVKNELKNLGIPVYTKVYC